MNEPAATGSAIKPLSLAILLAVLALFVWEARLLTVQIDDAYITFQYSKNLADGNGFVFNVGERVEGITNLLWAVMIAGGLAAGLGAEPVTYYLGIASGLGLLLASYWYAATVLPRPYRYLACFAPLLVYASNPFITWVMSGLETPLFVALAIAALAAQNVGKHGWSILFGVLVLLSRPDGVLVVAAVFLTQYIQHYRSTGSLIPSREILLHGGAYFLTLLALTVFRLVYFEDIVPNTFYAKVGGLPWWYGFSYVWKFLKDGMIFLAPFLVFAVWQSRMFINGAILSGLLLVYVLYIGGEGFPNSRFLLPVIPVLAAASLYFVAFQLQRNQGRAALIGSLVILLMPLWSVFSPKEEVAWQDIRASWLAKRAHAYPKPMSLEALQRHRIALMRNMDPPVQLVAAIGIGKLRYWSDIPVLDMVGLTNKTIAKESTSRGHLVAGHGRSHADYVLSRSPDVIVMPKADAGFYLPIPAVIDLWEHPEFSRLYYWDDNMSAYVLKSRDQS